MARWSGLAGVTTLKPEAMARLSSLSAPVVLQPAARAIRAAPARCLKDGTKGWVMMVTAVGSLFAFEIMEGNERWRNPGGHVTSTYGFTNMPRRDDASVAINDNSVEVRNAR